MDRLGARDATDAARTLRAHYGDAAKLPLVAALERAAAAAHAHVDAVGRAVEVTPTREEM